MSFATLYCSIFYHFDFRINLFLVILFVICASFFSLLALDLLYSISYFIQFSRYLSQLSLLVGTSGLEPPTSRLSGVRSNHLSYAPMSSGGGDEEVRTPDPLRARQVLSQLS